MLLSFTDTGAKSFSIWPSWDPEIEFSGYFCWVYAFMPLFHKHPEMLLMDLWVPFEDQLDFNHVNLHFHSRIHWNGTCIPVQQANIMH